MAATFAAHDGFSASLKAVSYREATGVSATRCTAQSCQGAELRGALQLPVFIRVVVAGVVESVHSQCIVDSPLRPSF